LFGILSREMIFWFQSRTVLGEVEVDATLASWFNSLLIALIKSSTFSQS
jgi:hypothetical protein